MIAKVYFHFFFLLLVLVLVSIGEIYITVEKVFHRISQQLQVFKKKYSEDTRPLFNPCVWKRR